jgi:hypothetical protein
VRARVAGAEPARTPTLRDRTTARWTEPVVRWLPPAAARLHRSRTRPIERRTARRARRGGSKDSPARVTVGSALTIPTDVVRPLGLRSCSHRARADRISSNPYFRLAQSTPLHDSASFMALISAGWEK